MLLKHVQQVAAPPRIGDNIQDKIQPLKNLEPLCYQICYHILQSEILALQASEVVFIHLLHNASFLQSTIDLQQSLIQKEAIKASLQIYQKNLIKKASGV